MIAKNLLLYNYFFLFDFVSDSESHRYKRANLQKKNYEQIFRALNVTRKSHFIAPNSRLNEGKFYRFRNFATRKKKILSFGGANVRFIVRDLLFVYVSWGPLFCFVGREVSAEDLSRVKIDATRCIQKKSIGLSRVIFFFYEYNKRRE